MSKKCKTCGQTKPAFKFKRKLTLAETRARGGLGQRRMEVESVNCTECRAKRHVPVSKKRHKELVNLRADGAISELTYAISTQRLKQNAKDAVARALNQSWINRCVLAWGFYIDAISSEIDKAYRCLKYERTNGDNASPSPKAGFYEVYVDMLRRTRAEMRMDMRANKPPRDADQRDMKLNPSHRVITKVCQADAPNYPRFIAPALRRAALARWESLDIRERSRGRSRDPEAVLWREPQKNGDNVSPSTKGESE